MFPGLKLNAKKKDYAAKLKKLGRDHHDTLELRDELVVALFDAGKYEEAETLGRESLRERDRINGPGSKESLVVAQNLAVIYGSQGNWEEGRAMLDAVLSGMDAALGAAHESTIHTRLNFAVMLIDQSAMDVELAQFGRQHALQVIETLNGNPSPQRTIAAAIALTAKGYAGDQAAVQAGCDAALESALGQIGGEIPFATTAKYYLSLQLAQGEAFDASIRLGQQVLEERLATLGGDSREAMEALVNLYFIMRQAERFDEAQGLLDRFGLSTYEGAILFPLGGLRDTAAK